MKRYEIPGFIVIILLSVCFFNVSGRSNTPTVQEIVRNQQDSPVVQNEIKEKFIELIETIWQQLSNFVEGNVERIAADFPLGSFGMGIAVVVSTPVILWAIYLGLLVSHPKLHSDVKLERDISLTAIYLGNLASEMEDRFFDLLEYATDPNRKEEKDDHELFHNYNTDVSSEMYNDYDYDENHIQQPEQTNNNEGGVYPIHQSVTNYFHSNGIEQIRQPDRYPIHQSRMDDTHQPQMDSIHQPGIYPAYDRGMYPTNQLGVNPIYQKEMNDNNHPEFYSVQDPRFNSIRYPNEYPINAPVAGDTNPLGVYTIHDIDKKENGYRANKNVPHQRPKIKSYRNQPFIINKLHPLEQENYDNFTNTISEYVDKMKWDEQLRGYPNIPTYYQPQFSKAFNRTVKWPGKIYVRSDYNNPKNVN